MAEKLELLKLLQELRGFAEVGNRVSELRPLTQAPVGLRAAGQSTPLPVRRFLIPVSHEQHSEAPSDVPIEKVSNLTSRTGKIRIITSHDS